MPANQHVYQELMSVQPVRDDDMFSFRKNTIKQLISTDFQIY